VVRAPALLRRLVDGFWLVPGSIAVLLALLAVLFLEIDEALDIEPGRLVFGGDADAARNVLSTIAGSLITVAGLTFSLTIVVLTLISSQYTPRAIRSFLADRLNQVVAGAFVGIFAYCLIVLGAVRSTETPSPFVPVLSVTAAIVLALIALALLVVFVHHMGEHVQASNIVARLGSRTLEALDRLYPEPFAPVEDVEPGTVVARWRDQGEPTIVVARSVGYVQYVDIERLVECIDVRPVAVHVSVAPGTFVTPETPIVELWPRGSAADDAAACVRARFTIAAERDVRQDAAYGLRQLADVALKALSPGVNDPTTAVLAIGHSCAVLERLAGRRFPPAVRSSDEDGIALVVARHEFGDYLETAIGEIAHYAADNPRVVTALLHGLERITDAARRAAARDRVAVVETLAEDVVAHARESATTEREHRRIDEAMDDLLAMGRGAAPSHLR
jgi:uncharacterized membrane protein